MSQTVVLVTGGNRGLGEGLVRRYLALPNHTVIAGNRNPAHPTSKALSDLTVGDGSKLVVVKIDATVHKDAFDAVKELGEKYGIDHLDIVISNAGICNAWPRVFDLKLSDLKAHNEANVYGLISLYQATREFLKKSSKGPRFIAMGSNAGDLA
jgi:norsolorinic acid ketoreductase